MEIRRRCGVKTEAQRWRDIAEADKKGLCERRDVSLRSHQQLIASNQRAKVFCYRGGRRARERVVLRQHESENALVVITRAPFWMWTVYVYSVCVLQQQSGPESRVKQAALGSPLESCSQHLLLLRHTPRSLPAVIVLPVNRTCSLAAQSVQQKASQLSRVLQLPLFFLLVAGTRGAACS